MRILALLLAAFAAWQPATAQPAPPLTKSTYAKWRQYLAPSAQEQRWLKIAWRNTLWKGVIDAHRLKRPLLLWTMDGHPLGAT